MNTKAPSTLLHETVVDVHGLASMTLAVNWSDGRARHEDQLHVEKFSIWREADLLPAGIGTRIPGMQAGDEAQVILQAGELTPPWKNCREIATRPMHFDRNYRRGLDVRPRLGRFYPQGFLHGVKGIFKEALQPFRITELSAERLVADLNHPLAHFDMEVKFHLDEVLPGHDRGGGRCDNPLDNLLQYPGLAAPLPDGQETDYGDDADGMSRMDERDDALFYRKPRIVEHLDACALKTVNDLYRRLIPAQAVVLDLMASFDSHLQAVPFSKLHVLGMNQEELSTNTAANDRMVQDLNESPTLPFDTDSLDAVLCTASVEYLTRPREILSETLRVLRPGGVMAFTFSNRWFPTKAIHIWSELHEFERLGMVTQWMQQAGFSGLHTFSSRGWPRPTDDRHAGTTPFSDPVYAVWGFKTEA